MGRCQVEFQHERGQIILVVAPESVARTFASAVTTAVIRQHAKRRLREALRNGSPVDVVAPRAVNEDDGLT